MNLHWPTASREPIVLILLAAVVIYSNTESVVQTDYGRTLTATPEVERPSTPFCVVTVMQNQPFGGANIEFRGDYRPPSDCPPPWAKVVLSWNARVDGSQIDRLASLWIGGAEVFSGSTPLATRFGATWQVDKDVTQYAALLEQAQTVAALLPNPQTLFARETIYADSALTFYATGEGYNEPNHPDMVVPLSPSREGSWFTLKDKDKNGTVPVTLPRNIVQASLEVYATGHDCEEYWYAVPSAGCRGATPFREIRVLVDGQLAGVAWPFPLVYAGSCDTGLWRPVPSINTLNIPPYSVNLTPFAGRLSDGSLHTISLQVVENYGYWRVDGNLLLSLDPQQTTTGGLTNYDIHRDPVTSDKQTALGNEVQASSHAERSLVISGYTQGSQGRVETKVREDLTFDNHQALDIVTLVANVDQLTTINTVTAVEGPGLNTTKTVSETYTIKANCQFQVPQLLPDAFDLTLGRTTTLEINGSATAQSSSFDAVHATSRRFMFNVFSEDETREEFRESGSGACYWVSAGSNSSCAFSVSKARPNLGILAVGLVLSLLALFAPSLRGMGIDRQTLGAGLLLGLGLSATLFGTFFSLFKYVAISGFNLDPWTLARSFVPELIIIVIGSWALVRSWRSRRLQAGQT